MKISGTAALHADSARVYEAFNDPAVLRQVIPGCEALDEAAPDEYRMLVTVGVGSIKGTYKGEVRLAEQMPPHSFVLKASGAGGPGTVAAECRVLLIDNADGTTSVEYDADAVVGGMVAGVGQRMLTGVAKKMAGQFFASVDDVLNGRPVGRAAGRSVGKSVGKAVKTAAPRPEATDVEVRPGAVAAVSAPQAMTEPQVVVAASAAIGALAALGGVLLGWLIGRSQRR